MQGERVFGTFFVIAAILFFPFTLPAQESMPGNEQAELIAAIEDYQFGDTELAISRLENLNNTHPGQPDVLKYLAKAYAAAERHDKAINAYRAWLSLAADPVGDESRFAHVEIASELMRSDRNDEAASELQKWLAVHPDDRNARMALGDLLVRMKQFDEAGPVWSGLLENPASSRTQRAGASYYLGWIAYNQGRDEEGKNLARQSLEIEAEGVYADPARELIEAEKPGAFSALITLGEYYTSNVELLPDYAPATTKKNSDYATQTMLTLAYRLPSDLLLSYSVNAEWHANRRDYDLSIHKLKLQWDTDRWTVGPRFEYITLSRSSLYYAGGLDISWHDQGWAIGYGGMYKKFSNNFSVDPATTAPVDLQRLGGFSNSLTLTRSGSIEKTNFDASLAIIDEATKGDSIHNKTDSYRQGMFSGNLKHDFGMVEAGGSAVAWYRAYNRADPLAAGLKRKDQYIQLAAFAAIQPWQSMPHRFEVNGSWQRNTSNYNKTNMAWPLAKEFSAWRAGLAWSYLW